MMMRRLKRRQIASVGFFLLLLELSDTLPVIQCTMYTCLIQGTMLGNERVIVLFIFLKWRSNDDCLLYWKALARMARAMAANAGAVCGPGGEEEADTA